MLLKVLDGGRSFEEENKLNPVQPYIAGEAGHSVSSREPILSYMQAFEKLDVVNRSVSMVVDDTAQIPIAVGEGLYQVAPVQRSALKASSVERILNWEPNPFQDISLFRRNLLIDLVTDGNAFIHFDGKFLYHLPAHQVTIITDERTYIAGFRYAGSETPFLPSEVIHIKENSIRSSYRGQSRLRSCQRSINTLLSMQKFQDNFFKNGAIPGLVLSSDNVLSDKVKERAIESWMARYNPTAGGRRPMILDGGMKLDKMANTNFKELDFESSIANLEEKIIKAVGIPPILMNGGNNANIRPNLRLYYLETILPLMRRIVQAFQRYFGFEMHEDIVDIPALQPELKELANYLTSLTNGGLITPDEARADLGKPKLTTEQGDGNTIRVPANIAGSAADPGDGGRPPADEE